MTLGLLIAGTAGQGAEATARLLGRAALAAGLAAALAIDRAPSRSAGSVLCRARLARGEIRTPFLPPGQADILLALDRLEALRWVHEVRREGLVAVDARTLPTPRMRARLDQPPEDALARIRAHVPRAVEVGALAQARALGRPDCAGAVLLGLASPLLPLGPEAWEAALAEVEPRDARAAWRLALAHGRALSAHLPAVRAPVKPEAA